VQSASDTGGRLGRNPSTGGSPRLQSWVADSSVVEDERALGPHRLAVEGGERNVALVDIHADHFGHDISALEIADDHVHLFVQTDPNHSPADIARQFKSYSGKHLLEQYLDIRESYFWGGGFWKVGYSVGTTGAVSEGVVERYIEETEHAPE